MPIDFVCSCGKHMKAKDAFAGRKIKCPRCDTVVRIPPALHRAPALASVQPAGNPDQGVPPAAQEFTFAMAPPIARKVVARRAPEVIDMPDEASVHAWIDRSLAQQSTPWRPGDEEYFQSGVKAPREGWGALETILIAVLAVVGIAVVAWLVLGKYMPFIH